MKKTLSALLLLSTVIPSLANATLTSATTGSVPAGASAAFTSSGNNAGVTSTNGSDVATINITLKRHATCKLTVDNPQVEFDETNYKDAKIAPFTFVTNTPGLSVSVTSTKKGLTHTNGSDKIDYTVELYGEKLDASTDNGIVAHDLTEAELNSKASNLKIQVNEKDYDKAAYGNYSDSVTLTIQTKS
ncbi:MAG: hypothetical protein J0G29_05380 [Alphaproteobacteria bacterium]|mgnify:CR=1 FL=1|nr:hypothetical protein [Alphaproteobacteria bacterium]OJV47313.1 MAG: hypothetical protein BGO28_01050 [Alphaproteobacteria bacterium 43-37]